MRLSAWFVFFNLVFMSSAAGAQSHSVPLPSGGSSNGGSSSDGGGSSNGGGSSDGGGSSNGGGSSKDPRKGKKRLDPGKTTRSDSNHESAHSHSSDDDSLNFRNDSDDESPQATGSSGSARLMFNLGGHLTLAGTELQKTSNPWGGGPDVLLAIGPKTLPLLFGAQFGFDWFGSRTERFMFNGELTDWDIDRTAFWTHAVVRWMPLSGMIRPHVDLLGGVWFHDVTIDEDLATGEEDDTHSMGASATGSYGFGLGVDFATEGGFLIGLSALHLRGGSIKVPDIKNIVIVDDVLYYNDVTARGINQWMFLLTVGGVGQ